MKTEADLERIQIPQITADWGATDRNYQMTCDLLGDIMGVEKRHDPKRLWEWCQLAIEVAEEYA